MTSYNELSQFIVIYNTCYDKYNQIITNNNKSYQVITSFNKL